MAETRREKLIYALLGLQHGAAWLLFVCNEWMHEQMARGSDVAMEQLLGRACLLARLLSSRGDLLARCLPQSPRPPPHPRRKRPKTSAAPIPRVASIQATTKIDRGATEGPPRRLGRGGAPGNAFSSFAEEGVGPVPAARLGRLGRRAGVVIEL